MKTLTLTLALLGTLFAGTAHAQSTLQPSDVSYEGYRNVRINGDASTYGKALTHRYVNGELRFLTLSHDGTLFEFAPGALSGTVTSATATWQLPSGMVDDFTGIWWEAAKNRLWVTRTLDYGEAGTFYQTRISVLTLGSGGSVSGVKTFSLQGVTSKQVFGGAQALPAWAQTELGCTGKPYLVGFGGYTSLMAQTSPASVGPAMFCIPDPDTFSNNAAVPSSGFKTLLNAVGNRGYRITPYTNQVDQPGEAWVGTNPAGSRYFTWHDSYYQTGMWIEGTTKRGYVAIASVGTGTVRYADGGVQTGGTAFELHIWNPTRLDDGLLTRPDAMSALTVQKPTTRAWSDYGVGKMVGATYDATSGRVYGLITAAADDYTARLYSYTVNTGGPVTPPPPPPTATDAVVSTWSDWTGGAWSACVGSMQSRTETRARTILTPATNGGSTPTLSETRTASQSCVVEPPPPPPPPVDPCVANPGVLTVSSWPSTSEGSRQVRYSYTVAGAVVTVRSVSLDFTKLTVIDSRGCSTVRTR